MWATEKLAIQIIHDAHRVSRAMRPAVHVTSPETHCWRRRTGTTFGISRTGFWPLQPLCCPFVVPAWSCRSPVRPARSTSVSPCPEEGAFLLLVEPTKESAEARIGLDLFDGIEGVAQLIVGPCLVDEVLARVAGGHDFPPALAPGDDMVSARRHGPSAKHASLVHATVLVKLAEDSGPGSKRHHFSVCGLGSVDHAHRFPPEQERRRATNGQSRKHRGSFDPDKS